MLTIEQLKERIKKLEERISVQEETLKETLDFIQRAIDTQLKKESANYKQWKSRTKELEHKIDKKGR